MQLTSQQIRALQERIDGWRQHEGSSDEAAHRLEEIRRTLSILKISNFFFYPDHVVEIPKDSKHK